MLEFVGPGIANLPIDFRNGIDVMTTETTCLSSIWETDEETQKFYATHKRPEAYKKLHPGAIAYYDRMITIDLGKQEAMIALPFHPSNAWTIHEFLENAEEILRREVGVVFATVLEHAGVYKCTPEGREAFLRFVQSV